MAWRRPCEPFKASALIQESKVLHLPSVELPSTCQAAKSQRSSPGSVQGTSPVAIHFLGQDLTDWLIGMTEGVIGGVGHNFTYIYIYNQEYSGDPLLRSSNLSVRDFLKVSYTLRF